MIIKHSAFTEILHKKEIRSALTAFATLDEMVEHIILKACEIAKDRNSTTLRSEHVQRALLELAKEQT